MPRFEGTESNNMKTIAEISKECGVHRTTLNKAIERKAFPARKSGSILLIDEESEEFRKWLVGSRMGRPRIATREPT